MHISQTDKNKLIIYISFVEFKVYISLKLRGLEIQREWEFCRIQNLHISQTTTHTMEPLIGFVEFKIYISLKHMSLVIHLSPSFVEFKIYISLKRGS